MDGTGAGSCPVTVFAVNSVEPVDSVPRVFDDKQDGSYGNSL